MTDTIKDVIDSLRELTSIKINPREVILIDSFFIHDTKNKAYFILNEKKDFALTFYDQSPSHHLKLFRFRTYLCTPGSE